MVSCKKNNYRRQYRFVWNSSFRKTKLLLQIDYSLQTFITIAWINFVNIFKKAFLAQWLLGQWRWKWVPVSVSRRQLIRNKFPKFRITKKAQSKSTSSKKLYSFSIMNIKNSFNYFTNQACFTLWSYFTKQAGFQVPFLKKETRPLWLNARSSIIQETRVNWFLFFSMWIFFHEHSRITGLQGKG